MFAVLRREVFPMLRLGVPLVLAELGWMSMGVVDTIMAGHAGTRVLSGVAMGHGIHYTFAVFGTALMAGLDSHISQAYGRGDMAACRRSLASGMLLALLAAPLVMAGSLLGVQLLGILGIEAQMRDDAWGFVFALSWGMLPLMLYSALRRYLQALHRTRALLVAVVAANLVNFAGNLWLIPRYGAAGSGWSTTIARVLVFAALAYAVHRVSPDAPAGWWRRASSAETRAVFRLGLPAALQFSLELAVFTLTASLIGKLGPVPLAGHQIALNLVSVTYMVPLGLSSAVAVRVGHALGRREPRAAIAAGWTGIAMGALFMALAAAAFWTVPHILARAYSHEAPVIAMAVSLLSIGAWFQFFDGVQAVATGALRGAGNTHSAMYAHLVCYWGLGLPLGIWLAFYQGWGAQGLWVGLTLALVLIGTLLLIAWRREAAIV